MTHTIRPYRAGAALTAFTAALLVVQTMSGAFIPSPLSAQELLNNVSVTKSVDKTEAGPAEQITYTLSATNDSTSTTTPIDVMLVIDDSGSMNDDEEGCTDPVFDNQTDCEANGAVWGEQPITSAKEAAKNFVNQLGTNDRSGVARFDSSASLAQALTFTHGDSITAIDGLVAGGGTRIDLGIDVAKAEFDANARPAPVKRVMIVLSDGESDGTPEASADLAIAAGIRVIAIGLGSGVNETQMRAIASSESDYYFAPSGAELATIYTNILGTLCDVKDITITDDFTDVLQQATLVSTNPAATQVGNELSWTYPDVGCGATVTAEVTVEVKADAVDGEVLENSAVATTSLEESAASETVETRIVVEPPVIVEPPVEEPPVVLTPVEEPALTVSKTVSRSLVNPGDTIEYTVVVSNVGDAAAENVTLDDDLPKSLHFVSNGEQSRSWDLGDLPSGESKTVTYDVKVEKSAKASSYENVAVAASDNAEAVKDSATVDVVLQQIPILQVEKTADVTTPFINPDAVVTYTVTITNVGTGTATDLQLKDALDNGLRFVADGATTSTWDLGSLQPGAAKEVTYDVRVGKNVRTGTYANTAVASATNADPAQDTVDVDVRAPQVLGASTTVLPRTGGSNTPVVLMTLAFVLVSGLLFVEIKQLNGSTSR